MMSTIFIVEDEEDIVEGLTFILQDEGYQVFSYNCGIDALKNIMVQKPDLILLDIMLPDINGIEICANLKNNPETAHIPVLVISAKSKVQEIIDGINIGCNDYITKPFNEKILLAKIQSHLRIPQLLKQDSNVIKFKNLTIISDNYEVFLHGRLIKLTPAEFKVLHCLMDKMGTVLKREQIIEYIDPEYEKIINLKSVDILITRVRKKLDDYGKFIESIYGVGYRFRKEL